eukprot:TRINITY_DN16627_c0_g3_i1.p1 TRINITY_DN16627_c0_g3~~TRINITY_DN16627_c0_g3_i1.p1  ORF type:complete len:417 (+),score=95.03 TRINITY_DN16627_c0_g3_i1:150-1253(+)
MVVEGVEFWFLLAVNITVWYTRHVHIFEPELYHVDLPWGLTGATGSLMTFFVCFYNSHVFGRYQKLYTLTKLMGEAVLELVSMLRLQVQDVNARRQIAKLVVSSCLMFFYERTATTENTSNVSSKEYRQLKTLELLDDREIKELQAHCKRCGADALPSFIVLLWAMELMRLSTEAPEERDDMLGGFYAKVHQVRKCQANVIQILDLPMPFQYFHIMNLMLALNLMLWAYSLGCQDSWFAPVIFMFVQMMFQGIRELSTALSDPFGEDEVDFPLNDWMMGLYARVYGILEDPYDISQLDLDEVESLLDPSDAYHLISMHVDMETADEEARDRKADYTKLSTESADEEQGLLSDVGSAEEDEGDLSEDE